MSVVSVFELYDPDTQKLLRTIPGVGVFCAAALVAFIGDINRFSSPEKLVAYTGLDCSAMRSGTLRSLLGRRTLT